ISQVKAMVRHGMFIEDAVSPFEGILRSIIAVFLIPATQVIVSYSIDVGNSMAFCVEDWVDVQLVEDWCHELMYNVNPEHHKNVISPPDANLPASALAERGGRNGTGGTRAGSTGSGGAGSSGSGSGGFTGWVSGLLGSIPGIGGFLQDLFQFVVQAYNGFFGSGGDGLGANVPEGLTVQEDQLMLSGVMQLMCNGTTYMVSLAIIVLTAYQVVFMCYLFLMGPIAAALYAWPNVNQGANDKFRGVLSNWVEAVICLSLWRFYWMLGLAIMTTRLKYIGGGSMGTGDLQWEVAIFITILTLMLWSAMNPFVYDPGKAYEGVEKLQKQGQETAQKAAGGGQGGHPGGAAPGSGQGGGVPGAPRQPGDGDANISATNFNTSSNQNFGNLDAGTGSGSAQTRGGRAGLEEDRSGDSRPGAGGAGGRGAAGGDDLVTTSPFWLPPPTEGGAPTETSSSRFGDTTAPPIESSQSSIDSIMQAVAAHNGIERAEPMAQSIDGGAPAPLEARAGGDTARYNQNATDHVQPALASRGAGGGGRDESGPAGGRGGHIIAEMPPREGGDDSGGSPPAAPPPQTRLPDLGGDSE
ncbi:MAG: hypothetical protein K2Z81_10280, partial [Cyanobacteria bacterium]|nr:hypothetical protein [Cyanobacteriota bacterium]